MRIAIFTDTFLPQVNGVVTVTLSLATHLADRGHKVYIIAPRYRGAREFRHPNVIVKRVSSVPAFFYKDFRFTSIVDRHIHRYLTQQRIDLIHLQTPITLGMQAVMLAYLMDVPLVGTYHTLISDPQYLRHVHLGSQVAQRLSWTYAKIYYERCELITCPTEAIRRELVRHGFKRPIAVISNGIDEKMIDNSGWRAARRRYNPDGPLLLFAGRIAHEKNLLFLIDAFAIVHKAMPTAKLLIVGDGPQMHAIVAHIGKRGLDGAIILAGSIPHDAFLRSGLLKAADVFVTASTTETQCVSILEAQACATPAVGIRAYGVADVIADRRNGLLVPARKSAFSAAILKLLRDGALRERLGRNARRDAHAHAMKRIVEEWERRYNGLLAQRRR